MTIRRPPAFTLLLAALLVAGLFRTGLLMAAVVPFNSDEAVVGLMARHILQGERPVFFYGQAYMGSLDAWLVAGAFGLVGQSVLAIRLVQTLLYLGLIGLTYCLGLEIYKNHRLAGTAALFMAVPTVLVTLYTTASLGGYGEALLIGNGLLLLALKLTRPSGRPTWPIWGLGGFLGGLGFWGFPLILIYLASVTVYLLVKGQRHLGRWALAGVGFAIGAAPWLWYTSLHGLVTLTEMSGSAIVGISAAGPVVAFFQHLFNLLLFGWTVTFGLRPPWGTHFLALPLAPLALTIYAALTLFIWRRTCLIHDSARPGRWLLLGQMLTTVGIFVLTPFGADPSGRYFLPLAVPGALFLAEMLEPHRLKLRRNLPLWGSRALTLGLLAFHWWGNLQCAATSPPGLTTQFGPETSVDWRALPELMTFLRAQGETRGYTNYWVEFPLAFLSNEDLLYVAQLPYHADLRYTPRDDRYPAYAEAVARSHRVAYITTSPSGLLNERLRAGLTDLGVSFQEKQIGDFYIFYALSRAVVPAELDLAAQER